MGKKREMVNRCDLIRELIDANKYTLALDEIERIPLDEVPSIADLYLFAELYEKAGRMEKKKEIFYAIYDRTHSRHILYQLLRLLIRLEDLEEARALFLEYEVVGGVTLDTFDLRYRLARAEGEPRARLIEILEDLKKEEYTEEWGYQLALLYEMEGERKKCIRECEDLKLWFGEGGIVEKARRLKERCEDKDWQPPSDEEIPEPIEPERENIFAREPSTGENEPEKDSGEGVSEATILKRTEDYVSEAAETKAGTGEYVTGAVSEAAVAQSVMTETVAGEGVSEVRKTKRKWGGSIRLQTPDTPTGKVLAGEETEEKPDPMYGLVYVDEPEGIVQPVAENVSGPVPEAAPEHVSEPIVETAPEHVSEPIVEAAPESVYKPIPESVEEGVSEPVVVRRAEPLEVPPVQPPKNLEKLLADEKEDISERGIRYHTLKNTMNHIKYDRKEAHFVFAGGEESITLAVAKRVAKELNHVGYSKAQSIVKVAADRLNGLELSQKIDKLRGACMLVTDAPVLTRDSVEQLTALMEENGDGIVVMLSGPFDEMDCFLGIYPELAEMLTYKVRM